MAIPSTGYTIPTAAELRAMPLAARYGGDLGYSRLAIDGSSWYTYQHGVTGVDDGDELLVCTDNLGAWVKHSRRLGAPRRKTLQLTTVSIPAGDHLNLNVPLGNLVVLLQVTSDKPCRIRLYNSGTKRTADRDRAVGASPVTTANDHGVLLDEVLGVNGIPLQMWLAPAVSVYNVDLTGMVPALITNLSGGAGTLTLGFLRTILEL